MIRSAFFILMVMSLFRVESLCFGQLPASNPTVDLELTFNGLKIGIDRSSGAINSMEYTGVGQILSAQPGDGGLLDIAYPVQGFVPLRLASKFSKARITPDPEGEHAGVTITYDPLGSSRTHAALPDGKVRATLGIRPAPDGRSVILTCMIDNQSSASIPQVLFPDLHGLRPFSGLETTKLRMTNGAVPIFAGSPRPTEKSNFYGFEDGWRVYEYGGYYAPHVLRWADVGGFRGGLSMFERRWGGTTIPNLLVQRLEADPQSARLAWEHRVTIASGTQWNSSEFWLTPHEGGWAKGIEVFRSYVDEVNPRRLPPRHVLEGLGFQSPWLVQTTETDPAHADFKIADLPRIAADAKAHGIDELCAWGIFRPFTLPLAVENTVGSREDLMKVIPELKAMGVNLTPFISIALLDKASLAKYGITSAAPGWIYHPELIRNMDPYYMKAGNPVVGTEIGGAPLDRKDYVDDAMGSFKLWIDLGLTSFGWDVVCSQSGGKMGPLIDILKQLRSIACAQDPESTLCGEIVPNGNLEWDNQVIDYIWCWVPFTEADPLMNLFRAPRSACTIEDHAVEVKKAFAAGLYMNLLPRKPDRPNGTALISEKPELSAALKEVAPLRRQFLDYFTQGTVLGDSFLSDSTPAFVRGYQLGNKMLVIVLNTGEISISAELSSKLDLWLPAGTSWRETVIDGQGKSIGARTGAGSIWTCITQPLQPLELMFYELEIQ